MLVGEEGLEPSLSCENQILSLARLPIPPLAQRFNYTILLQSDRKNAHEKADGSCYNRDMKIAILGLGREGSSAKKYFEEQMPTAEIEVFDPITPAEIATRDWSEFDLVMRSPSLSPPGCGLAASTYPQRDQWQTSNFSSVTRYFFAHCPAPILGVTGTKGKGTTCSLAAAILERIVAPAGRKVFVVGNIGIPALDKMPQITERDLVVFELSSFQLWDLTVSPHVAVVLGIEPDHLNVHRDFAEYVEAKSQIVRHQKPGDICVYNAKNAESRRLAELTPGEKRAFPVAMMPQLEKALASLKLLGEHNRHNAEAALLAAAGMLGLSLDELLEQHFDAVRAGLANFEGLPHRLELVKSWQGVDFYDSSYSTDATAMQAALGSFTRPVILILGGHDKTANADFAEIREILQAAKNLKQVILVGESGEALGAESPELGTVIDRAQFDAAPDEREVAVGSTGTPAADAGLGRQVLTAAVQTALQGAAPGDVILLSPAAASFDMFKDASQRGEVFQEVVQALTSEGETDD